MQVYAVTSLQLPNLYITHIIRKIYKLTIHLQNNLGELSLIIIIIKVPPPPPTPPPPPAFC